MELSTTKTIILGAIAGSTIMLGLPFGRLRSPALRLKAFLNAASAGVLLFLLFDILSHATEPVEEAFEHAAEGEGTWARAVAIVAVYVVAFAVGLLVLVYQGRRKKPATSKGRGAMAVDELERHERHREATRLSMLIATGIGLHNFSEGLAIGAARTTDLALLLIVGFALHNATEGFGIVGPLAAGGVRASWPSLLLAGLVGGGPTFLGTVIGVSFTNEYVSVGFLALAAGTIIFVIAELLHVGRRLAEWKLTMWGVLAGFMLGLATELVIEVAKA